MIKRKEGESVEELILRWKRQVSKDGTLLEVRKREFYLKPGVKRKEKSKLAAARKMKKKR